MARTLLIRMLKEEVGDQILNYILNMIPEKVRKIVGWILIIFGALAILGGWFVAFFFTPPERVSSYSLLVYFQFFWVYQFGEEEYAHGCRQPSWYIRKS